MDDKGKLIILSGPSGVGKDTIAAKLVALPGIEKLVTATTRAPRPGEENGIHYHFLLADEFRDGIRSGRFLEHAEVHGNFYGTPRESVEKLLHEGKWVILAIDIQGARQVRENPQNIRQISIFLLPPDEEALLTRLKKRGSETSEEISVRMDTAREELKESSNYDYQVVNDDIGQAIQAIQEILGENGYGEDLTTQ